MDVVSGTLALIGDSAFGEESGHHRHLFDPGCTVHLLPTAMAYEDPAGAIAGASEHLAKLDNEVRVLDVMKRADSSDAALAEQVRDARAIYVIGGSPMHLRSVLKDTPLLDALVGAWSHGATDEGTALVRAPDGSWGVTGSGEVHVFAEGRRVDLDGLPRTLNPDAGF
jgi:cyanophycinase